MPPATAPQHQQPLSVPAHVRCCHSCHGLGRLPTGPLTTDHTLCEHCNGSGISPNFLSDEERRSYGITTSRSFWEKFNDKLPKGRKEWGWGAKEWARRNLRWLFEWQGPENGMKLCRAIGIGEDEGKRAWEDVGGKGWLQEEGEDGEEGGIVKEDGEVNGEGRERKRIWLGLGESGKDRRKAGEAGYRGGDRPFGDGGLGKGSFWVG